MPMHCAPTPPPLPSPLSRWCCCCVNGRTFSRSPGEITRKLQCIKASRTRSSVQFSSAQFVRIQFSSVPSLSGSQDFFACVDSLYICIACIRYADLIVSWMSVGTSVRLSACLSRLSALITLHFERRLCLSGSFLFFFCFFVSCVFFFSLIFRHIARWVRRIEGQMK